MQFHLITFKFIILNYDFFHKGVFAYSIYS